MEKPLRKKVKLLRKFGRYLDKGDVPKGKFSEHVIKKPLVDDLSMPAYFKTSYEPETAEIVYLHRFKKLEDGIMFELSNGTVQVNFMDICCLLYTSGGMELITVFKQSSSCDDLFTHSTYERNRGNVTLECAKAISFVERASKKTVR